MASSRSSHPCEVCQHPDRGAIDMALVNGKSLRAIARDFAIGTPAAGHHKVARHRDQCMADAYQSQTAAVVEASGAALVDRMRHLDDVVDEVIRRAREGTVLRDEHGPMMDDDGRPIRTYKDGTILAAIREARRNTELRARLAGAMTEGDEEAMAAARLALQSPEARRAVQDLEAMLADEAQRKAQGSA